MVGEGDLLGRYERGQVRGKRGPHRRTNVSVLLVNVLGVCTEVLADVGHTLKGLPVWNAWRHMRN